MIVAANFPRETINSEKNCPGIHVPTINVHIGRILTNMDQLRIEFTL